MPYRIISLVPFLLALGACSNINQYNPFSEDKPTEAYRPANATEYQCDGNKRFFVRRLTKENAVWLIYPEREVRLESTSEGSQRYSNGIAVLEIDGGNANLTDGSTINYLGCKSIGSAR